MSGILEQSMDTNPQCEEQEQRMKDSDILISDSDEAHVLTAIQIEKSLLAWKRFTKRVREMIPHNRNQPAFEPSFIFGSRVAHVRCRYGEKPKKGSVTDTAR